MAPSRRVPLVNVAGIGSIQEAGTPEGVSSQTRDTNPNGDSRSLQANQGGTRLPSEPPEESNSLSQPGGNLSLTAETTNTQQATLLHKSSHEWKLLSPRSLAAVQFTNELDSIFAKSNPKGLRTVPNSPRQGAPVLVSGRPPQNTPFRSKGHNVSADGVMVPLLHVNQLHVGLKEGDVQSATPSPRLSKPNFMMDPCPSPGGSFGELAEAGPLSMRVGGVELSRFGAEKRVEVDEGNEKMDPNLNLDIPAVRNTEVNKKMQPENVVSAPSKRTSNEGKLRKQNRNGVWKLDAPGVSTGSLEALTSNSLELVKKENSSGALILAAGSAVANAEEKRNKPGVLKTKAGRQLEQRVLEQKGLGEKEKASPRGGQLKLEVAPIAAPQEAKPDPESVVTWTGDPPLLPQPHHGRHPTHVPQPLALFARQVSVINLPADISKMSPKHSPRDSPRGPVSSDPPPIPEKHFPMAAPQLASLTQSLYEKEDVRLLPGFGANHWVVYDRESAGDSGAFPAWKAPARVADRTPRGQVSSQTPGFENPGVSTGVKTKSALQAGFENLMIVADLKGIFGGFASEAVPLRPASHNAWTRVVKENGGSTSSAPSSGGNTPRAAEVLSFESRFESGNLRKATLVGENEYDLSLQTDIGMSGHTQWFYFGIRNMRPKTRYKFNILNLLKPKSLFQEGMRILAYSERLASTIKQGWFRTGDEIAYFPNKVKKKGTGYYTLTFVLDPPFADDTLYLAYCYPYTYSDLQSYLKGLCSDPARSIFVERELLCRTLSGNRCDVLTITSPGGEEKGKPKKRAMILTARVHPGESNASWMMKGALDFLTSARPEAEKLRELMVFKIVPMLNPDGVINGNHRCSLAQVDLNRVYTAPLQERHPTVWHTKEMVKRLQQERDVIAYVDLHGHSAKKNIFMYGCENKHAPAAAAATAPDAPPDPQTYAAASATRLAERVFPYLVSKAAPDAFSFADCNFRVQKSKESTARVVGWRELGLLNCLTLEASFAGPSKGRLACHHFTMSDLMDMGASLCRALLDYCAAAETPNPDHSVPAIVKEVEALQPGTSQADQAGSDEDSEAGSSASDDIPHDLRQGKGGLAWQLGGRKTSKTPAGGGAVAAGRARAPGKRKKRRKKKADLEELARKMGGTAKVHSEIAASVSAMLREKEARARAGAAVTRGRASWTARPWADVGRLEELGVLEEARRMGSFRRLPVEAPVIDLGIEGSVIVKAPRRSERGNFPLPRLEKGSSFKVARAREMPSDLDLSWLPPL